MGVLHALRFDRSTPPRDGGIAGHRAVFLELLERNRKRSDKSCTVLDLGRAIGANVDYLSTFAGKIHLEDLGTKVEQALRTPGAEHRVDLETVGFSSSTIKYDLVLAWDLLNYLNPSEVKLLGRHIAAVSHPGTLFVAYFCTAPQMSALPCIIRLHKGGRADFEQQTPQTVPCPRYSKSQLRALLPGFKRSRSLILTHGYEECVFRGR